MFQVHLWMRLVRNILKYMNVKRSLENILIGCVLYVYLRFVDYRIREVAVANVEQLEKEHNDRVCKN